MPFAFHKTKEVRTAVFELLRDLVGVLPSEHRSDLAMIVVQGLLLESTEVMAT